MLVLEGKKEKRKLQCQNKSFQSTVLQMNFRNTYADQRVGCCQSAQRKKTALPYKHVFLFFYEMHFSGQCLQTGVFQENKKAETTKCADQISQTQKDLVQTILAEELLFNKCKNMAGVTVEVWTQ